MADVNAEIMNHVLAGNSTSVLLAAGGVFTGDWFSTVNFSNASVMVQADVASAVNGLVFQQSMDGVTVDDTDSFTILANSKKQFTFGLAAAFVRVVYTNGGTDQGLFRLQTILHKSAPKPSSHRISDMIIGDDDAELSKAVITGLRDDGVFGNAMLDNENRLVVSSQDYLFGIAEGAIANHYSLLKFGTRTTIAAGVQSTIWEGPTALYPYMTTAQQLKVLSSSAQDGVGGTGILTLQLVGLDSNYDEITETITMNGITAVTTVNSYIRIFRAFGVTCGSSLTNVGTITITNNAGTVIQLIIPPGDGQTLMTLWTVPNDRVFYATKMTFSTNSNKGARVSLFTRLNDGGTIYPWQIKYRAFAFSGSELYPFDIPFKIPAKTDIEVRTTTPVSAGDTSAGATFEGWYESIGA